MLIPPDQNFLVTVSDILPGDGGGRVLYWSQPSYNQALEREGKGNIYLLELQSAPWAVENRLVVSDYAREPGLAG